MNWEFSSITNSYQRKIRYGYLRASTPKAVIYILPGRTEFIEKYTETATYLSHQGFSVICLDWIGQGKSDRYLPHPQKHHSLGFDQDVEDLNQLLHTANIEIKNLPKIMLAHSMGGNIGLRYLAEYPSSFCYAGFSAPMIGINTCPLPAFIIAWLTKFLCISGLSEHYIPFGKDWTPNDRLKKGHLFSSDRERCLVQNTYCLKNPQLQIGHPTIGWVFEALASCQILKNPSYLQRITCPVMIAMAGREVFVSNKDIKNAARILNAKLEIFEESAHEILMEKDSIRDKFLLTFLNNIEDVLNKKTE